jgi:serine protease inhibitor
MSSITQNFSVAFWNALERELVNGVVSPVSILAAFSMLLGAARSNTLSELKTALQIDANLTDDQVHAHFQNLLESLQTDESSADPDPFFELPKIAIANRLFVQKGYKLEDDYLSLIKKFYKSEIGELNFVENEKSAEIINTWVSKSTNEKIQDLIESSALGPNTRLVIANAIYFKGKWINPFKDYRTEKQAFHLLDGSKKDVDTMSQEETFRVLKNVSDLNAAAVELPFQGNRFSLVILVPEEVKGLASVESALNQIVIQRIMNEMELHRISLSLPKFKVESTLQLKDIIVKLGAKSIFDAHKADLSGITKAEQLFVSKAVHKAFLSIDEQGAEAAAATGLSVECMCLPLPPEFHINVDRPFLTWIWDSQLKSILFMARVCSP